MGKDQPELGVRKRFEFRPGVAGFPNWQGMDKESNPASIDIYKLQHAENVRFRSDGIIARGGQSKLNASQLANSCIWVGDFPLCTPYKLYLVLDGCPGKNTVLGTTLIAFDYETSPQFQRVVYQASASNVYRMAPFDDVLYLGLDSELRALQLITYPYGQEALETTDGVAVTDRLIGTFSGFTVSAMKAFDSQLYTALDAGAGASKIAAWDGLTLRDDVTAIDAPTGFGLYRELLIAGFAAASNKISYRTVGASPGTWTNVAPGAGTVAMVSKGVSYKDKFYFPDGGTGIWVYDGATLASAHTVAGATMNDVAVFNGFLYFGYDKASHGIVGKYDGTTWTDVEKDLNSVVTNTTSCVAIEEYRGSLFCACTTGTKFSLLVSDQTDTTTFAQANIALTFFANADVHHPMVKF